MEYFIRGGLGNEVASGVSGHSSSSSCHQVLPHTSSAVAASIASQVASHSASSAASGHHFEHSLSKMDHFRTKLRPHSTPVTLSWLERNYELSEGVCIPR